MQTIDFLKSPKESDFFSDTILHIGSLQILINRYVVCCHSQIADSIMCCSTLQFFVNLSLSVEYEWHNKQVDPFFFSQKIIFPPSFFLCIPRASLHQGRQLGKTTIAETLAIKNPLNGKNLEKVSFYCFFTKLRYLIFRAKN